MLFLSNDFPVELHGKYQPVKRDHPILGEIICSKKKSHSPLRVWWRKAGFISQIILYIWAHPVHIVVLLHTAFIEAVQVTPKAPLLFIQHGYGKKYRRLNKTEQLVEKVIVTCIHNENRLIVVLWPQNLNKSGGRNTACWIVSFLFKVTENHCGNHHGAMYVQLFFFFILTRTWYIFLLVVTPCFVDWQLLAVPRKEV